MRATAKAPKSSSSSTQTTSETEVAPGAVQAVTGGNSDNPEHSNLAERTIESHVEGDAEVKNHDFPQDTSADTIGQLTRLLPTTLRGESGRQPPTLPHKLIIPARPKLKDSTH